MRSHSDSFARTSILITAALGAAGLLAALFWHGLGRGPEAERGDHAATRSARAEVDDSNRRVVLASEGESRSAAPVVEATRSALEPAVDALPWVLRGRLVARTSGSSEGAHGPPLAGYSMGARASGAKNPVLGPEDSKVVTAQDGTFEFLGVEGRGPWDLFASPPAPGGSTGTSRALIRVASTFALPENSGNRPTYTVAVGPLVVLRSPLPAGVEPSSILFEGRGRKSSPSSKFSGYGGFAVGFEAPDGTVQGFLPPVTDWTQGPGFGVRAVTRNGLFAAAVRVEGNVTNEREISIEEALSPRGRVRLRLDIDGLEPGEDATRVPVAWTLPLGDPERDGLGLPPGLASSWRARPSIALGGGVVEVGDLPLGPVQIALGPAFDLAYFEVTSPVSTMAVHGDPETVIVPMRPRE